MKITIPELALVTLVGVSGSGKSTFARKHFKPTEVLSSDYFRALVSDDENDQTVTSQAFAALHFMASQRLELGKLTVVDATNVQPESRKPLIELARRYHCIPVAIVVNTPEKICSERNKSRPDRDFGEYVIRNQHTQLKRSLRNLKREGFRHIYIMDSLEEIEAAFIERQPLWTNRKHENGPFDIIGDVHGCFDELKELLETLGYQIFEHDGFPFGKGYRVVPPDDRKILFVGDLIDRGPKTPEVLRLAMSVTHDGVGLCVPGNHDSKLVRKLDGKDVQLKHGLAETMAQLESESSEFKSAVRDFLDSLVSHYVFDEGKLVVAHAGMKEEYQGRGSGKVREFALFGETTGETDEFGLPVRFNWASEYRGRAMVVYGHTPVPEPEWLNRTINIDTGCVFGGQLTGFRYPEKEIVSVPSQKIYAEPARPLVAPGTSGSLNLQQQHDDLLDIRDVIGKRFIRTTLSSNVTVREENAIAALEAVSRFAANPKWLIYIPPTMSPSETSSREGYLEYPTEAFTYYRNQGAEQVICEEKHMGSRAVVVLCKDQDTAKSRFGITDGESGIVYTRTGRRFFDDKELEAALLDRVRSAISSANLWNELKTNWICLDCELMPWSVKAQELLRQQYAAVGCAAQVGFVEAIEALQKAQSRGIDLDSLPVRFSERLEMSRKFVDSYRQYCWPVSSLEDLKVAPFHILATEGEVHTNKNHQWHMENISKVCAADPTILRATQTLLVSVNDEASVKAGVEWWESLTNAGGEGMVIKPLDFILKGKKGLAQPAVKCRGREYLRIIYGAEYTAPEHLERLRSRGLSGKRSLALREFAVGVEGLERFVRKEPLRFVHECIFGVLALESEPVDPRL
jgi:protein phosphatase